MLKKLSANQEVIMTALCYGKVFDFPLRLEEFSIYMPLLKVPKATLAKELERLVNQNRVLKHQNLFALPGCEKDFEKRLRQEEHLQAKWDIVIASLPTLLAHKFIKGALLTGSLAAKNPDGHADADLLLVLHEKRLWVGYLWVRLWCKWTKKGLFCPNYILGHRHLELSFPNYFTAVEYAMSVPLKWDDVWNEMEGANPWLFRFLPNAEPFPARRQDLTLKVGFWTKCLDALVASPIGWLINKLEWWRLKAKTRGVYSPSPYVYKPHAPRRQWEIYKKLWDQLDCFQIEFQPFRKHIREQIAQLEKAQVDWQVLEPVASPK